MSTTLAIDDITQDPQCQPRQRLDESTITEYAQAMHDGATFPPVTVYQEGATYWLADGFHRVAGAQAAGITEINVDIRPGRIRDAMLHAVGANATHGLRRSNTDKRRAVETMLTDDEWSRLSDREIARRCAVTHPFVAKLRRESGGNGYHSDAWVETVPGFISYTVYPGDPDRTTQSIHDAVRAEYGREGLHQFKGQMAILGDAFTKVNRLVGEERFRAWLTAMDDVGDQFLPAFLYAWAFDTLDTFVTEHPAWRIVRERNSVEAAAS